MSVLYLDMLFYWLFFCYNLPPLEIYAVFTSLPPHNARPFTKNSYLLSQRDCCSEVRKVFGLVTTDAEKKGNKYKSPLAKKEEIHKVT